MPDRGDRPQAPLQPQPPTKALDPPMVPLTVAGTAIWAVVGLVLLVTDASSTQLRTCVAGLVLGSAMTVFMWARDRHRRAAGRR